jgi:hypothetical protein
VPSINRDSNGTEHKLLKLGRQGWKGVKTTLTWVVQQPLPHFLIIDQEEIRMKFNKCVIVKSKMMNGDKIFMSRWNMQHILKDKITSRCGNNGITNTSNVHTQVVRCMNLIIATIGIIHDKLVEIPSDVICGTTNCYQL